MIYLVLDHKSVTTLNMMQVAIVRSSLTHVLKILLIGLK